MDGAWLSDRPRSDLLVVEGADRLRFLNGYLTCDVKAMPPERVGFGFFTAREGRVLASAELLSQPERVLVALPAGRGEALRDHLRRYVISDRVTIEIETDTVRETLFGDGAVALLERLGLPVPSAGEARRAQLAGGELWIARRDLGRLPAFELWLRRAALAAAKEALGAPSLDAVTWDRLRVEEGIGLWGVDYGDEHFPQETGREAEAVSYRKGCYLGQEVVARIHYRGGVQRALVGLRFAGEPPEPGTSLVHDGREAGRVGSVARSPRHGPIGLAVVHRRAAEPATALAVAGGGEAVVARLPFATTALESSRD